MSLTQILTMQDDSREFMSNIIMELNLSGQLYTNGESIHVNPDTDSPRLARILYEHEKRRRRGGITYSAVKENENTNLGHNAHSDSLPFYQTDFNMIMGWSNEDVCRPLLFSSCHDCYAEDDFDLDQVLAEKGFFVVFFRRALNNRKQHAVGKGQGVRITSSQRMSYLNGHTPTFEEWCQTIQNCEDFEDFRLYG